jgi:hypothetical protein
MGVIMTNLTPEDLAFLAKIGQITKEAPKPINKKDEE